MHKTIFVLVMLLGVGLLLRLSLPVAAQEPQPPTPTTLPTNTPAVLPTPFVPPTPAQPYPAPGNPTVTPRPTRPPEERVADLAITIRAKTSITLPGELLEFTIALVNGGDGPADDVVVTDALPEVLSLYNATTSRGLIGVSEQTVRVEIGRLEAGDELSITIVTLVNGTAPQSGYTNRVGVSTNSRERDTANNAAQASFAVGLQSTAVPATPSAVAATPTASAAPTAVPPVSTTAPPTPPLATAVPPPTALPDTGANVLDMLGLVLLALGALGLGVALLRRVAG